MKRTLSFLYLDFYTVKPYFRNSALILIVGVFLGFVTKTALIPAMMTLVCFVMLSSYPFMIGEKNGMGTMYATLPLKRGTVVVGRYLFALATLAAGMLFAFLVALLIEKVSEGSADAGALFVRFLVLTAVGAILLSLQYPFYFRYGYGKAKFVAMVPLLILTVGFAVASTVVPDFSETVLNAVSEEAVAIALPVAGAAAPVVSIGISYFFYRNRDL